MVLLVLIPPLELERDMGIVRRGWEERLLRVMILLVTLRVSWWRDVMLLMLLVLTLS